MTSQVKLGAILAYFTLAINILIGIIYTPWMIRCIGPADYGLYTLAMSIINIFVFDFGLGAAVQRFIAKYQAEKNEKKAQQFISVTLRLYLVIDIIILLVLIGVFFLIPHIYKGLSSVEIEKFKIVYAVAAIFSVISFPTIPVDGILSGSEKFIQLKICDFIHKVAIVLTMTFCLLRGYGLYALVLVNAISGLITIAVKWFCVYKYTKIKYEVNYWDNQLLRSVIGFSSWVLISAVCQRCVLSLAPSILGIFKSSTEISIFSLALSIEGYYYTFANAINGLFLPRVSSLIANNKTENIMPLMIRVGNIQIIVIGLLFLGLICFGEHFISIWVGKEFMSVYACMIVMIFPSFISLPENIAYTTMVAQNKVRYNAYSSIIKATTNILLAFPLAKFFGAWGISLSVAISYMMSVLYSNYNYIKILKLNISLFFKKVFGHKLIPLFILMGAGCLMNKIIATETWGTLILKVIVFSVVYIIVIIFVMGKEERMFFLAPIKRIIKRP